MNIEKIFNYAKEKNISDIHLIEGEKIYFRKDGKIIEYDGTDTVSKEELLEICNGKIEEDFAYTDLKNDRYRVNSFLTRGKLALVIRVINKEPIKLKGKFINKLIDEKILFL